MPTTDVQVTEVPARNTLSVRRHTTPDRIGESFGEAMTVLGAYRVASGAQMSGPPFARYHSWGDDVEVEVGITIAGDTPGQGEVTRGALPAGRVARVVHTGPYPSLGEAYQAVEAWMRANGHEGTAPPWEVYLTDPQTPGLKPDDYKTEILWPIG